MPTAPQEGGGKDGRSTQALVPQSLEISEKVWTDGQTNVHITVVTQYAKYRLEFSESGFLELTAECTEQAVKLLRAKVKGR